MKTKQSGPNGSKYKQRMLRYFQIHGMKNTLRNRRWWDNVQRFGKPRT